MLRCELLVPLGTLYHAPRIKEACDGLLVELAGMKRSPTLRPFVQAPEVVAERRQDRELGLIVTRFVLPRAAAAMRSSDTVSGGEFRHHACLG